jgi:divinyl chlorophyllide a 8-vinyl-reductase
VKNKTFNQLRTNGEEIESVVSCLASRSGIKKEAFAIDYQASLNCMEAGIEHNAKHFVLLSAICVKKPLLQFQLAKLEFEAALRQQSFMTYSIVRPTAFFKSVSGQLERLLPGQTPLQNPIWPPTSLTVFPMNRDTIKFSILEDQTNP